MATTTHKFTPQQLNDIDAHAGTLARALKALCPAILPEPVKASLVRLKGAYLLLGREQDSNIQRPTRATQKHEYQAALPLAEVAEHLLAAFMAALGDLLAQLQPEAQDAAARLWYLLRIS